MRNKYFFFLIVFSFVISFSCNNSNTKSDNNERTDSELMQSDPMAAFNILNEQIKEEPKNAQLYNQRANFFLLAGQANSALSDVNMALQLDSLNANIWVTLADVYFEKERFVDSREVLKKSLEIDPNNTSALLKLARLYLIYREYNISMAYLDRALYEDPILVDAFHLKAVIMIEQGDTTAAILSYQKAVDINPEFYDAWIGLGILYSAKGNPLAEQYYINAVNIDTNNTHAIYILALYYQQNNQLGLAEEKYRTIIRKEVNENAWYNLGYINLVYRENYNEAISCFQKALNINPDYNDALFNLALSLEMSGDKEDARLIYLELLKKVPNHTAALEQINNLNN